MNFNFYHIVLNSLIHYRKQAFYQLVIITVLASVITGSLLTGYSVKESLKKNVSEKLGRSDLIISSGLRYFSPSLSDRFEKTSGLNCTAIFSGEGICQNFATGRKILDARIIGTGNDFFEFNDSGNWKIEEGSAVVNSVIAEKMGLKIGDEIIITLPVLSDIPASSPFAPSKSINFQSVLKIIKILPADSCGNFSLDITQGAPLNVFVNINDLFKGEEIKSNLILIENKAGFPINKITEVLKNSLAPEDVGLSVRSLEKFGGSEIISSRVFIDQELINQIEDALPQASPILTYLVNSIDLDDRSAPYSFVSAIDEKLCHGLKGGNSLAVNRWLADDLNAEIGDTVLLTWYNPGKTAELEEKSEQFIISGIIEMSDSLADPMLMPEFPGISGKESCSEWDAGVKIDMESIRAKDEDYWNVFKGTPKAFISYQKGKEIWGNNFGPATAVRFGKIITSDKIVSELKNNIYPLRSGLTVRDIRDEMIMAADESVDFSTLFLSLGFFIIVSSVLLLVLAVKSWFDSRKAEVFSMYAIGIRNRHLRRIMLSETALIAFAGSLSGVIFGMLVNYIIILALNSVWKGAVQTDNIIAFPGLLPLITGFIVTYSVSLLILYLLINRFLRSSDRKETRNTKYASVKINFIFIICSGSAMAIALLLFILSDSRSASLSFISGGLLFVFLMTLWRHFLLKGRISSVDFLSSAYYRFHPGRILMPVLLIAAGLFAVVITGINRMQVNNKSIENSGGTGGFNYWVETTVPVTDDLTSEIGLRATGLWEFAGKFRVVQIKRTGGDDASCLNLNHVTSPPILGTDPSEFIKNGSFSFASLLPEADIKNPWEIITRRGSGNLIYGFADQTVLEWGLKKKTGDTLLFRSESGELLKLVIAGGLKASLFQGNIITDSRWLDQYYPSVSGSSVFLIKCEEGISNQLGDAIRMRFEPFGVDVIPAIEKLEAFFEVTNTYLSVFTVLGGFGIILGVAGLGFVLRFNYNLRRKEFALMLATGFTEDAIRKIIVREQVFILFTGILTGVIPGLVSTIPSISAGGGLQLFSLVIIIAAIAITGLISLNVSVRSLRNIPLAGNLRMD